MQTGFNNNNNNIYSTAIGLEPGGRVEPGGRAHIMLARVFLA